jgi:DNA polymerase-3 subunit epsilon
MSTPPTSRRHGLLHLPNQGVDGMDLAGRPLAVVDVETTGFTPGPDRVVEIAVVRIDLTGRIEDQWDSLLHPGRDVGPTSIHHITEAMVENAPTFADVADEILERLDGAVVVAHNARFDASFITHELTHAGIEVPAVPGACTIELARWSGLPVPNYRLATCCGALGLTNNGAHTALGDARVTAELAVKLLGPELGLRWDIPTWSAPSRPPGTPSARQARPDTRPT